MRIAEFKIENKRSIVLAKCSAVPPLMIITGPNGAGKSTLLYELRNVGGRERILYVGPHRSSRRRTFRQQELYGKSASFEEMLCQDNAPEYYQGGGFNLNGGTRDPWNTDDSGGYLKYAMCQIEVERQQAISAHFDRTGEIAKGTIPDPWKPFRDLTNSLLPHLRFSHVDNSNRDRLRCVWHVHSRDIEVDLDDLSSGEKAIIQMFYPLLEHEVRAILEEITVGERVSDRAETCVLIDEPELHLHPNLQVKVLDYLRIITSSGKVQVILVSHSPVMAEHASYEELFLLRPVELVDSNQNQLMQIAGDEERLKLLRSVFGATSNVTAMQPVIIVEGTAQTNLSATVSDRKLYRALCREFDAVSVIPGGGKSECIKLLEALNGLLPSISSQLRAVALLDRDVGSDAPLAGFHVLPVSMIENFLLDPPSIWEAIQSVVERTALKSVEDVATALDKVLDELRSTEIERRAKATLGLFRFRPESPLIEAPAQAQIQAQNLITQFSTDNVNYHLKEAEAAVISIEKNRKRREHFHGKDVLDAFYRDNLKASTLPKIVFKYEAACRAQARASVSGFFRSFFAALLNNGSDLAGSASPGPPTGASAKSLQSIAARRDRR